MMKRALAILPILCIVVLHATAQDNADERAASGGEEVVAFGQAHPGAGDASRRPVAGHAAELPALHRHAGGPLPADARA